MELTQDRSLADLDARLALAVALLRQAREAWAHSPCARTIADEEDAEAAVNQLLEQRYALQPRRPAWR